MSTTVAPIAFHPAADIFPLIEGEALAELVNDIRTHGLHEPIVLHPDGSILDGRNRFSACREAGVEPRFRTWDGEGSVVAYVVSLNLHRRHLSESQRAMVAARIANLSDGQRADRVGASIEAPTTQIEAAEMLNVGRASVQRAREVIEQGTPELVQAVERGDVAVSTAAVLTELEPETQTAIVALPEPERKAAIKAHVAQATGNNEWYTPAEFIEAAKGAMGSIDLDPSSTDIANRTVKAATFYTAEQDGLTKPWSGNVWMNPPYAKHLIERFVDAVSDKYDAKDIKRACVLVNNATETAWFQRLLESAAAVCFIKGRVRFLDPEGNPGAPLQGQAVVYLGENPFRFARSFAELGCVLVKPE